MSLEFAGIDILALLDWLLTGVELFIVQILPLPWNLVAQGAVDIMQALLQDLSRTA